MTKNCILNQIIVLSKRDIFYLFPNYDNASLFPLNFTVFVNVKSLNLIGNCDIYIIISSNLLLKYKHFRSVVIYKNSVF